MTAGRRTLSIFRTGHFFKEVECQSKMLIINTTALFIIREYVLSGSLIKFHNHMLVRKESVVMAETSHGSLFAKIWLMKPDKCDNLSTWNVKSCQKTNSKQRNHRRITRQKILTFDISLVQKVVGAWDDDRMFLNQ